jgi:carbamoyltransferase
MVEKKRILGISAYYHDSAAALVVDGEILAAAQEERFSRTKFDARFPGQAIEYCLRTAGVKLTDITNVIFYDKPLAKFDRLLETYIGYAPCGLRSFATAMPVWLKEKLYLKSLLKKELKLLEGCKASELPPLLFAEHHQAHAASAFFPSPFERAGILCMDGVGEWATSSVWLGEGNHLTPQWEIDFPHSLGLLYSAFTYYTGFKVNSGEYKLMGLAPYGEAKYTDIILRDLIDLKPDGTFRLNTDYFNYTTGLTMTNRRFDRLFGGRRESPSPTLRNVKWISRPRFSKLPKRLCCAWRVQCTRSWALSIFAWRAALRSTASRTVESYGRDHSATCGSSPPPETRVEHSAQPLQLGTNTTINPAGHPRVTV